LARKKGVPDHCVLDQSVGRWNERQRPTVTVEPLNPAPRLSQTESTAV
jgi:hypothetical protein